MRDSKLTVFVDDLPLNEDQTIVVIDSGFARRDPAERNSWDLTRIAKLQKHCDARWVRRSGLELPGKLSQAQHLGGVILMQSAVGLHVLENTPLLV